MEIKPIEKVPHCGDCEICNEGYTYLAFDKKEVRKLEADFKEAIEALEIIRLYAKGKLNADCHKIYEYTTEVLKEIKCLENQKQK